MQELLTGFLRQPKVFADLLDKYTGGLPSDDTLTHDLVVDMGFVEQTAREVIRSLRESAEHAGVFDEPEPAPSDVEDRPDGGSTHTQETPPGAPPRGSPSPLRNVPQGSDLDDPIPVRLRGGRKAWITLPKPFQEQDKHTLKAQIDLLIADDKDDEAGE